MSSFRRECNDRREDQNSIPKTHYISSRISRETKPIGWMDGCMDRWSDDRQMKGDLLGELAQLIMKIEKSHKDHLQSVDSEMLVHA